MKRKLLACLAYACLPLSAQASQNLNVSSTILVERTASSSSGETIKTREASTKVLPGDTLVFVLAYKNQTTAPAKDFVLTNPIPSQVVFQSAATPGAVYSVDGGKIFGALEALTTTDPSGQKRSATPADVTHVRWTFKTPVLPGQAGEVQFLGAVR